MEKQGEDLSNLLEYKFQITYSKLAEIIKKKTKAINNIERDIEKFKADIKKLFEESEGIISDIQESQERNKKAEVEFCYKE